MRKTFLEIFDTRCDLNIILPLERRLNVERGTKESHFVDEGEWVTNEVGGAFKDEMTTYWHFAQVRVYFFSLLASNAN